MRLFLPLALALACLACPAHSGPENALPPSDVYDSPVTFVGEWLGEIDTTMGTLKITALEPRRLRGVFRSDDKSVQLVLAMEQLNKQVSANDTMLTNQVAFTWQDGRGGRGHGYLMVGREDTSLSGAYGYDDRVQGAGEWTFIRVE